jgi:ribosomal protein S18 acetylase RimI-like enzyme
MLDTVQGQGLGRKMMETLLAALAERGVRGIHLGMSRTNTGAAAFYRKLGFSVLEEDEGGLSLGRLLSP